VADERREEHRCEVRGRIQKTIYPGDRVVVEDEMIEELLPRDNLLSRPRVANISAVNIMLSVERPEIDFQLLDRFLLLVEAEGFRPVIFINKIDLDRDFLSREEEKISAYREAGYSLYTFSVREKENLDSVRQSFQRGINVMAGPSGVGKSALINELVPDANLELGEISEKLKRGKHTTRQVKLLALPEGGWVADSPGFTSLSLEHLDSGEVRFCFPEFDEYAANCHFSSCTHSHEPDCGVKKAVTEENINEFRYESYLRLLELVKEQGGPDYD